MVGGRHGDGLAGIKAQAGADLLYRCGKGHAEPLQSDKYAGELVLTPLELIDRIAQLVPAPRTHRHRCFRLLRRRLTINSPRMAVRSALPWPFRWAMAALVFGFYAAIALWAFEFGKVIIILTNLVCNARENGPIRYRLLRPGTHPGLADRYRMVLVFRTFRFDAFCRPRS